MPRPALEAFEFREPIVSLQGCIRGSPLYWKTTICRELRVPPYVGGLGYQSWRINWKRAWKIQWKLAFLHGGRRLASIGRVGRYGTPSYAKCWTSYFSPKW